MQYYGQPSTDITEKTFDSCGFSTESVFQPMDKTEDFKLRTGFKNLYRFEKVTLFCPTADSQDRFSVCADRPTQNPKEAAGMLIVAKL